MPLWTTERDDELRSLYVRNLSCRVIAAQMGGGLSRNAIIGRVHRLKLELRGASGNGKIANPNRIKKKRVRSGQGNHSSTVLNIVAANGNSNRMRIFESRAVLQEQKLRCVEIVPFRISLLALEDGMCRYPFDGAGDEPRHVFCGHPRQERSSFCTPHHHLCWDQPKIPSRNVAGLSTSPASFFSVSA